MSRVLRALKIGWAGVSAFLGALLGRSARGRVTARRSDVSGDAKDEPRGRRR